MLQRHLKSLNIDSYVLKWWEWRLQWTLLAISSCRCQSNRITQKWSKNRKYTNNLCSKKNYWNFLQELVNSKQFLYKWQWIICWNCYCFRWNWMTHGFNFSLDFLLSILISGTCNLWRLLFERKKGWKFCSFKKFELCTSFCEKQFATCAWVWKKIIQWRRWNKSICGEEGVKHLLSKKFSTLNFDNFTEKKTWEVFN